jgi:hypothetical protein
VLEGEKMRDTIDMAREVKATAYTNRHYPDRTTYTFGPEQLKAFEALVRADEREACAKVCESQNEAGPDNENWWECADAIRARGNT